MEEYQKEMKGLALKLIGLMLGSLGLNYEDVKWLKPKNSSRPQTLLQLNSYPVCPDPTRAMGLAPHTDSSLLTLLNQSSISGLQVLVDGIRWVPAHPIPGALVVNVGDLMGSGTISGPTPESYGSLLEITWNTPQPLTLSNGEQRGFLEDGDTLTMKGYCEKDGLRIGFGEVTGKILPAVQFNFQN